MFSMGRGIVKENQKKNPSSRNPQNVYSMAVPEVLSGILVFLSIHAQEGQGNGKGNHT
jgi:hypothetical protein